MSLTQMKLQVIMATMNFSYDVANSFSTAGVELQIKAFAGAKKQVKDETAFTANGWNSCIQK